MNAPAPINCMSMTGSASRAAIGDFMAYWKRRLAPPKPNGQSQAAYWQACRKHHVANGNDRVIAGELAWRDLENVKCQRNPNPAKGMVVMPLVEEQPRSCAACNRSLKNSRATSKYCSRACQQRAYRTRQSVTVNPAPRRFLQDANSAEFPPRAGVTAGEAHPVGSRHSGVGVLA